MRSTGWSERVLGAGIALTLVAGLGAVAVHDDAARAPGTAAGPAVARRPSSSATSGQGTPGAPPAADSTDTSTDPARGRPGAGRTTRRTSTTFAHGFSSSSAPLPPDTLAPPPAEQPAPPPAPPSDDVANELIAGVLDLVDVDPEAGVPSPG